MSRLRTLFALLLLTILVATGCSSGGGEATDDEPAEPRAAAQDLRVAVGDDPFMAGNPPANDIGIRTNGPNPGIFETLTRLSPTYGVEAALAERWETSNPKTWKFFLRRDVTFHNGSPFNAEAVVASLDAIAGRATRPRGLDRGTAKATAPDIVEVNLSADNARLSEQLANPTMAMMAPGTRPGAGDTPENTPTGTGPFQFVSYNKGTELKMKVNDKYWGGTSELKTLTFRFGPERDVSRLLATRQVEIAGMVGYGNLASVSGRTDKNVQSRPGQAAYLLLNIGGIDEWTTLKDDNLRKALAHSIDRNDLAKTALGRPRRGQRHADPGDRPRCRRRRPGAPPPLNRNEAKKILDGAGWMPPCPTACGPRTASRSCSTSSCPGRRTRPRRPRPSRPSSPRSASASRSRTPARHAVHEGQQRHFDLYLDVRAQDDANPCALCRFFTIRPGGQFSFSASVGGGPKVDDAYDRIFSSPSIDTARRTAADIMQVVTAERFTAISIASLRTEWLISPRVRGFEPAVLTGDQRWDSVFLTV